MMCHRIGWVPISTIGLGRRCVSSLSRVPRPPARITAFIQRFCDLEIGKVIYGPMASIGLPTNWSPAAVFNQFNNKELVCYAACVRFYECFDYLEDKGISPAETSTVSDRSLFGVNRPAGNSNDLSGPASKLVFDQSSNLFNVN